MQKNYVALANERPLIENPDFKISEEEKDEIVRLKRKNVLNRRMEFGEDYKKHLNKTNHRIDLENSDLYKKYKKAS